MVIKFIINFNSIIIANAIIIIGDAIVITNCSDKTFIALVSSDFVFTVIII